MSNTQHIMLAYDDYCALDNQLTNWLLNDLDKLVSTHEYNDHILHFTFEKINANDDSFISFDDKNHTISVYFASRSMGLSPLENKVCVHAAPQWQMAKFYRLPA